MIVRILGNYRRVVPYDGITECKPAGRFETAGAGFYLAWTQRIP
jgi:hypothetical protein